MLPSAEVAAAVPVPLVVPPADSTVSEIELSTVPVTVNVPLLVAANAELVAQTATAKTTKKNRFIRLFSPFSQPEVREKPRKNTARAAPHTIPAK
jgi:hypothetical protein